MSSFPSQDGQGLIDAQRDGHGPDGHVPTRSDASATAGVSRAIVQLMARYSGRGPTKAKTVLDENYALVVLDDALTTTERLLVEAGKVQEVRRHREALQGLLRDEAVAAVEAVTGRRVRVALADVAPEEGVALQLFLFDGRAPERADGA
jgi:uncharacterized protein YbcI